MKNLLAALGALVTLLVLSALGQAASPYAIDIPSWFVETFLDLREDVSDAAKDGKRLLIYFGQDGCPYCKALMKTNFTQARIVDKTRRHFVALALNIWGDRPVTGLDGRVTSEKKFATDIGVQFTPTVLFPDEKGNVVARLNGYYPPHRFEAALDYVSGHLEGQQSFASYMRAAAKDAASEKLHDEPFFLPAAVRSAVRELRAFFPFARELSDEGRERLGVAGNPQVSCIHRVEAHVADQFGRETLGSSIVAVVHETRSPSLSPRFVHAEKHFARHGVECGHDSSFGNFPGELLRDRRAPGDDEIGIVIAHRQRTGDDRLARQVASLIQHIVDPRPVHG